MKFSETIKEMLIGIPPLNYDERYIYTIRREGGECIYVGQTKNIFQRLMDHNSDGKEVFSVDVEVCADKDSNLIEGLRISELKPSLNTSYPPSECYLTEKLPVIKVTKEQKRHLKLTGLNRSTTMAQLVREFIDRDIEGK